MNMMEAEDQASSAWQPDELAAARQQINDIDDQIVALLTKRFEAVTQVNEAKRVAHLPVMDHSREDQVLDRVANQDTNPETRAYMRNIFKTIMKNARDYQAQLKQTQDRS